MLLVKKVLVTPINQMKKKEIPGKILKLFPRNIVCLLWCIDLIIVVSKLNVYGRPVSCPPMELYLKIGHHHKATLCAQYWR